MLLSLKESRNSDLAFTNCHLSLVFSASASKRLWVSCSSFYCCDKTTWEGKGLFHLAAYYHQGKSRRDSGGRKHRPGKNSAYWLALWLHQSAFLHNPGPPAQGGPAHSGLGPHTSITNQEKAHTLSYSWSDGCTFSMEFLPSSQRPQLALSWGGKHLTCKADPLINLTNKYINKL